MWRVFLQSNWSIQQLNRLQQIQNCLAHAVVKAPKFTPVLKSCSYFTGSKSINVLSMRFFLLHIKFLLLLNLATVSLKFYLLSSPVLKLVLHRLLPSIKSTFLILLLIAHFILHLLAFEINFLPHSINLILIILFLILFNPVVFNSSVPSSLLSLYVTLISSRNSEGTFSLDPTLFIILPLQTLHCSMISFLVFPLTV